jgi:hypothetical protein
MMNVSLVADGQPRAQGRTRLRAGRVVFAGGSVQRHLLS